MADYLLSVNVCFRQLGHCHLANLGFLVTRSGRRAVDFIHLSHQLDPNLKTVLVQKNENEICAAVMLYVG